MRYLILIFFSLFFFIVIPPAFAQSENVPSPFCLGNTSCGTSPSPGAANPSTIPSGSSPSISVSTQPSTSLINPSPSTTPCATSQSSTSSQSTGTTSAFAFHHHRSKWHKSAGGGLLQQFMQFLLQLLQQLFKQLGINFTIPTTGCPSPSSAPSNQPSLGAGGGSAPSSQPSSAQPSSAPSSAGSTVPSTAPSGSTSTNPMPNGIPGTWKLLFDDEFNGTSLDTSKWAPYWFSNGATQNDTTMESSNVSESGGTLNLTITGNTGGIVSTNPSAGGNFQFTYGAVEARIYLPASGSQVANWPAFWTDGQSWPTDGEMDVMEGLGGPACYHFHDPAGGPGGCASGNYSGWHTFGADWQAGKVTYYYDGKQVGSITSGITSAPMYLILENSLGSPSVTPSTMKVDYVRVWQ